MLDVPIAFVTFNRPGPTKKSFQQIRSARPSKLFLISDAPRADRPGETELVQECRRIVDQVDWPCDVHKIYATANMGCGRRISSGISEAMEQVDRLIILEDDCVASPSFFPYCDELLDRYQDDQRVMAITGNNFQMGVQRTRASYYFSKYPHCWGWATWRRAWKHFQLDIPDWPEFRDSGHLAAICTGSREIEYWTKIFDNVHAGKSDSWAYPWTFCCWLHHGLTALPSVNLVSNIGFGEDATHTQKTIPMSSLPAGTMDTIVHPNSVARHFAADSFTDDLLFSRGGRRNPVQRLQHVLRLRRAG